MPNLNSDKLPIRYQITLFMSIQDFLRNGFSLGEAFAFCSLVHPELRTSVNKIKQELGQGLSFAESIKSLVGFQIYCQLRIAELHGDLSQTLSGISRFLKMKQHQKSKLLGLMIYPIFLLVLLIGIIISIRILVTPQVQNLSATQGGRYWHLWVLITLPLIMTANYGLWRYYHEQSRIWKINLLLKIPLIGLVYRSYYAYYMSSNLALMMDCGMDLQQIVDFMKLFKANYLIRNLSKDVKQIINYGGSLDHLRRKYHFLPREMMMLIESGDTTDVLAQKLHTYSKLEFNLMMKRSSRLIAFMQPVMFLIIGLMIMGTYLSMLLPMYNSIKGVY